MKVCFICGRLDACEHRELELLPANVRRSRIIKKFGLSTAVPQAGWHGPLGPIVRRDTKNKARQAVAYALRVGKLKRPDVCERCGLPGFLEAHHHDYDRPLDVIWVCPNCHKHLDSEKRAVEKSL